MTANMYRVGDYVYFETSSSTPYQIRRIEELNKTANGNVEAKVMCFYRRRDISSQLIVLADKHQSALEEENEARQSESITEKQRHQLKHRELFLSRQVENLPATHIRGKCSVTLLNETESLMSYLNKEDTFFYSLVYDPTQKTLLADKGEIRVGGKYQAEVPTGHDKESDNRKLSDLETLVWSPTSSAAKLTDRQIDQFMVVARSVGTFARALDCTSTVRQPSLHMSAAAASRDITLYHAMDTLHRHKYDMSRAIASLVPPGGPVLCRDEMEEWSASEANLFEEALDKYGKDFGDVRQDFLPWKSLKSIVEFYYMWKTTDRYVQQKRMKAAEAETKLKQVYIPNYNKPNPAQISNGGTDLSGRSCESCYTTQCQQWYAWGPTHMQCRLCSLCWTYWKKNGGLKMPTRFGGSTGFTEPGRPSPDQRSERLAHMAALRMHRCTISGCGKEFKQKNLLARHLATAHGLAVRAGSPRPVMKTRAAFCLITTPLTRISRQICSDIMKVRHAARQPFIPINIQAIKQECQIRLQNLSEKSVRKLTSQARHTLEVVVSKMGVDTQKELSAMLKHTPGAREPPAKMFYPKPPLHAMVPTDHKSIHNMNNHNSVNSITQNGDKYGNGTAAPAAAYNKSCVSPASAPTPPTHPSIMKKRGYEQANGIDGPAAKRPAIGVIRQAGSTKQNNVVRDSVINELNGRGGRLVVSSRGRKQLLNWIDAPDDVYFYANEATRKLRKPLTQNDFRRMARKPWRLNANIKLPSMRGSPSPAPSLKNSTDKQPKQSVVVLD